GGGKADAEKAEAEDAAPAVPTGSNARQFAGMLTDNGTIALRSAGGRALQSWTFSVIPDNPPSIRFAGEPQRAINGALELAYEIEDDYGAASADAKFE